jgi:hypothetical protein
MTVELPPTVRALVTLRGTAERTSTSAAKALKPGAETVRW